MMNTSRQRNSTLTPADRPVWPNHDDFAGMQSRWEGESASRAGSPLAEDGIEAFFHHALGSLDQSEMEDLLRAD